MPITLQPIFNIAQKRTCESPRYTLGRSARYAFKEFSSVTLVPLRGLEWLVWDWLAELVLAVDFGIVIHGTASPGSGALVEIYPIPRWAAIDQTRIISVHTTRPSY